MAKYHYRLVSTYEPMEEDRLNAVADEGWRLVSVLQIQQYQQPVFQYAFEEEVKEARVKRDKEALDEEEAFVEEIYQMYPSKCPKRNKPLGKCDKNRSQIRTLMKKYSQEQIRAVVQHELSVKLGKDYLKNFTTFLNQFPDPETIDEKPVNVRDQFVKPTNEWE